MRMFTHSYNTQQHIIVNSKVGEEQHVSVLLPCLALETKELPRSGD
jgi:hypothetical protein